MKILCLSDLHQRMTDISDVIHQRRFTPFLQSIRDLVEDMQPDVAVVTGDTVPTPYVSSLNAFFGNLFPSELPVVATLGNHEFWERPFEETLENEHPASAMDKGEKDDWGKGLLQIGRHAQSKEMQGVSPCHSSRRIVSMAV